MWIIKVRQLVWLWLCRSLANLRLLALEKHTMTVCTVFFVVLAIHFGHWGLLFCYFGVGVVPAVAFCFYIIGRKQLWDVNNIADILFLSESSMLTKLRALGPLLAARTHYTGGDHHDGKNHTTEEMTSSKSVLINNGNNISSCNNNAMTTITSIIETIEKPTSFNSFPPVDGDPHCGDTFPGTCPLPSSSSQVLTPDTPISCAREIEVEVEKYVNLITRDFVQSWYKMVCAEADIVEEIHDKIHVIMTDLCRRVHTINRHAVFVDTIMMYREQLTKFQTALATFKIQMTYGMNKTKRKQSLPSSLEDAFNLKYAQHPAAKDREASIAHIKVLFEIMINCMDVFPKEFKNITSMKEMLIEILTMQVAIPLFDMLEDPDFLYESLILLLSDTPVDFTNLIMCSDNQSPHSLPLAQTTSTDSDKLSETAESYGSLLKDPTLKENDTEIDEVGLDVMDANFQKSFCKEHPLHQHSKVTCQGFTVDNKVIMNCICSKCTNHVFISDEHSGEESDVSSCGSYIKPYNNSLYFNKENQKNYVPENSLSGKRSILSSDSANILTVSDEESDESNSRRNSLRERERHRSLSAGKAADLEESLRNYCDKKLNKRLGKESVSHSTSCDSKMSSLQRNVNNRTFDLDLEGLAPNSADPICNGGTPKKNDSILTEHRNSFVRNSFPILRTSESVPRLSPTDSRFGFPYRSSCDTDTLSSPESESDIISDDQMVSDKKYFPTCLFQDICVVETETRKESRSNGVYTLYQIQYDALYITDSGELALKTGEVKRRFREFLNLQLRLEEKRAYKKILKGIKGPKRWLCIPFGNMDQENVAQRKLFLDNYLKNLIKNENICNGPELKEFLAYEGDARIAFVRKAPEINVPRIDKAFVKTVSGVIDKLTNVLPRGLSQEKMPPASGGLMRKDSTSSTKSTETIKCLEDTDQLLFDFNIPNDDMWSMNIASGLRDYVKSLKGQNSANSKLPSPDLSEQAPLPSEININELSSLSEANEWDVTDASQVTTQPDPVLSSAILDLATQALQGCDSWVCKEGSYRSIQIIFGTVLDRWLQQKLDEMTSRSECLNYLQLLREKIWPNGKLSTQPPPQKSPAAIQMTKELAHNCLKEYFPRILFFTIGEDNVNHGIIQLLAAIQYNKLNRHFIFCLVDTLFLYLFPEVKNDSFQQNLFKFYMKDNEKSTVHSPTVEG